MPNDAALASESTISPDQSFLVHLQSLLDFARELNGQFEAVRKPTDDLATLASKPVLLGDFAEASALRARHLAAVQQMHDLLDAVRSAIGFADEVTGTISDSYERYDHHIAGLYGHHHVDSLDAPGTPVVLGLGADQGVTIVVDSPPSPGATLTVDMVGQPGNIAQPDQAGGA